MTNKIKVTGSQSVSEVIKAFFPSGVSHASIVIDFAATPVDATEKRATNNVLSLQSLCYALLKSGVVAKNNLANILAMAADAKQLDAETQAEIDKAIADTKKAIETKLPMVPVAATVRVKDATAAVCA